MICIPAGGINSQNSKGLGRRFGLFAPEDTCAGNARAAGTSNSWMTIWSENKNLSGYACNFSQPNVFSDPGRAFSPSSGYGSIDSLLTGIAAFKNNQRGRGCVCQQAPATFRFIFRSSGRVRGSAPRRRHVVRRLLFPKSTTVATATVKRCVCVQQIPSRLSYFFLLLALLSLLILVIVISPQPHTPK